MATQKPMNVESPVFALCDRGRAVLFTRVSHCVNDIKWRELVATNLESMGLKKTGPQNRKIFTLAFRALETFHSWS